MSTDERLKKLLQATPEQLADVDAALSGQTESDRPSLRLLRTGETAKALNLSRTSVWRLHKEGKLRGVEIRRGSIRFSEEELRRFVGVKHEDEHLPPTPPVSHRQAWPMPDALRHTAVDRIPATVQGKRSAPKEQGDDMTALQLAKSECANHEPDGTCLGVNIRDDGSQVMMRHAGERCLVARGERCRYFEDTVLPLVEMTRDAKRLAELTEAENDYEEKCHGPGERDMERGSSAGTARSEEEPARQPASTARLASRSLGSRSARLFGRRSARMGAAAAKRDRDR